MRTYFLTNVTAEEVFGFFYNFGQEWRNFLAVFYCEIRNTEARVYDARGNNGSGRACGRAAGAIAADVEWFLGDGGPTGRGWHGGVRIGEAGWLIFVLKKCHR